MDDSVTPDTFEGGSFSVGADGPTCTRRFIVERVEGNAHAKGAIALERVGIKRGDPHPSTPLISCDTVSSRALDLETYEVIANYKLLSPDKGEKPADDSAVPQIEVGATVQGAQTNRYLDADGKLKLIEVPIKIWRLDAETSTSVLRDAKSTASVEKLVPCVMLNFSRRETKAPTDKATRYVGKVNSDGSFGDPPRYWLCTRIVGRSSDGGETYDVSYEFQRNADSWDVTGYYTDPTTGEIPEKQAAQPEDNGIKVFQIYAMEDFTALKLFKE